MAAKPSSTKHAFSARSLSFLSELADNNQRDWFNVNKHRYESDVLEPALAFIETMGPHLEKISEHFTAVPKRSGGSLMRVYRDTRFSKDKTPYKTNVGIQFRHERGKDVHAPGFYLHIEPEGCFLGAGIWHPDSGALAAIRQRILERPDDWSAVIRDAKFRKRFDWFGDSLTRPPRGMPPDAIHMEDIKRKDFIAGCGVDDRDVLRANFVSSVAKQFARMTPLMRFLCAALELEY